MKKYKHQKKYTFGQGFSDAEIFADRFTQIGELVMAHDNDVVAYTYRRELGVEGESIRYARIF